MLKRPYFALGVLAEFIFIGLQVAGMSLFSSFAMQQWPGMTAGTAAAYLSILSLLFTVGRFVSTPIMTAVKTGSSALVMSIVGAALIPLLMSAIADAAGINVALLVAVPGFLYVAWYGLFGCKIGLERK